MSSPVGIKPGAGADDLVVTDLLELRLYFDAPPTALLDLELQDLTGLVWAASGGCAFPPEVSERDAAPLGVIGKERGQRLRVALVQCFGSRAQLIDHGLSMAARATLASVPNLPTVEILYVAGCPNYEMAHELVERVASAVDVDVEVRLTEVRSELESERLHFLGSRQCA